MNSKTSKQMRSGVALIIVLLIVLSATAVALLSMHVMLDDMRMDTAFHYNRQAAMAARAVSVQLKTRAGDIAQDDCVRSRRTAIIDAMSTGVYTPVAQKQMDGGDQNALTKERLTQFTGLGDPPPSIGDNTRLAGDLSRRTSLKATTGNFSESSQQIAGFSDSDAFHQYNMTANSYAVIGRPVSPRNNDYYLLSEINTRVSGFKREFGVYDIQPINCN